MSDHQNDLAFRHEDLVYRSHTYRDLHFFLFLQILQHYVNV